MLIITEDRLTAVAAVHQVLNRSGRFHAQFPGRGQSVPPSPASLNEKQALARDLFPSSMRQCPGNLPRVLPAIQDTPDLDHAVIHSVVNGVRETARK